MQKSYCRFGAIFLLLVGLTITSAQACPEGNYTATGWSPGIDYQEPPSYNGFVTIRQVGQVCEVNWRIGNERYGGIGIYHTDVGLLSVGYANLDQGWFGEISYRVEGPILRGIWAVYGDKSGKLGGEILQRQ